MAETGSRVLQVQDVKATLAARGSESEPMETSVTGAVAIGRYGGELLKAESPLVKCPSKHDEQYDYNSIGGTSK